MTPRPILKSLPRFNEAFASSSPLPFASCPRVLHSPHVHFPPTPALTTTETTHSSFTYDRAPIVVSPNACALPERGGRVYFDTIAKWDHAKEPKGSYFHPRAFEVCEYERAIDLDCTSSTTSLSASVTSSASAVPAPSRTFCEATACDSPPSLTPDMSSESEGSDSSLSPPLSSSPIPRASSIPSSKSRNTSYPLHHRRTTDTQHHEVEMASPTYPPSLVKDKKKVGCREKEKCGANSKKRDSRLKLEVLRRSLLTCSSFNEAPLDGCLSGF